MHVDRAISAIAGRQQAMIATRQLVALGLSRAAIAKRVRAGRLTPYIRGVYRVGPITPPLGPEAAALLACPGAVLSHLSAAALWGIAQRPDAVHITAATQRRPRAGVVPHRGTVTPRERRVRQGLALTGPSRTLADVRRQVTADAFRRIVWEASYRRLITDDEAQHLLGGAPPMARFDAERTLVALLTGAGLPAPVTNRRLHGWEVDLYWPEHRLVVELDGFDAHGGHRAAFERDRRKGIALEARGIRVLRVSGAQVAAEPTVIVATVAGALARTA